MYLDDVQCGKVNHNSNLFGVKLSLTTVVLVTLNLLVFKYLAGDLYRTVHEWSRGPQSTHSTVTWNDNIKKIKGYCASRGSRCSHLNLNFLSYRKTWSLSRDILFLSYGRVLFVLNWWYQMVLEKCVYCIQYFMQTCIRTRYGATVYIWC